MKNKDKGASIPTILLIVFVVLKLTGNIDWSWWWVLAPLWIPVLLIVPFVVLGAILLASDKPLTSWPRKDYTITNDQDDQKYQQFLLEIAEYRQWLIDRTGIDTNIDSPTSREDK